MIARLRIYLAALFSLIALSAAAQQSDTIVSLVNIYPGSDIYELEGHTVLRIRMPSGDYAVSFGTYDFNQPNFVYRFVSGQTDYWASVAPMQHVLYQAAAQKRRAVEHVMDFDPAQRRRLLDLVNFCLMPENRTYRYNYVKDNCATRPLRLIELAAGDSIMLGAPPATLPDKSSFRDVMRHYHRNYPWYQFGIDLALGPGIDYPLDNREKSFAPVVLSSQLDSAVVMSRPLISQVNVLSDFAPDEAVMPPTPWYLSPLFVCWAVFVLIALATVADIRRKRVTCWIDAVLYSVFGVAGLLITFLIFISVHEATSPNILLLWLNPFCFIPPVFIWINRCKQLIFSYQIVNFVALLVLVALWLAGYQSLNAAFLPLILADMARSMSYICLTAKKMK